MDDATKAAIGKRLRAKREQAGYTREKLGELCGLSPRFIANIEFGDSSFSLDSLMTVCRVLSCSSDDLLFDRTENSEIWSNTLNKLRQLDPKYQLAVDKMLKGFLEALAKADDSAALRPKRGKAHEKTATDSI